MHIQAKPNPRSPHKNTEYIVLVYTDRIEPQSTYSNVLFPKTRIKLAKKTHISREKSLKEQGEKRNRAFLKKNNGKKAQPMAILATSCAYRFRPQFPLFLSIFYGEVILAIRKQYASWQG